MKAALALVILAAIAWLFMKTVRDTLAEPYVLAAADLSGWTLALEEPDAGGPALLVLTPPVRLPANVFRQIFTRTGQSMAGPLRPSMPVVLHAEYGSALEGVLTPDELLALARKAGMEDARMAPVCMAVKQESTGPRPVERFFLVFESEAFSRFREQLAGLAAEEGAGRFDPAALPPIVPVASYEPDFERWWPLDVDLEADCQTDIALE
jgi:hypothetical protein